MAAFQSLRRNAIHIAALVRTLKLTHPVEPDANLTIVDWVENWAGKRPDTPAILFEENIVTYRVLVEGANRYARWALARGIQKGDVVGILMENRPEFIMAWLGMMKIGAIAALINSHLKGAPLSHCVEIAGAKNLILQDRLAPGLREALQSMDSSQRFG